jgi:toxin ParE1/3/4
MRAKLRFSARALEDIEDVLAYTVAHFGEKKCQEYKELIRLALEDIETSPDRQPAKRRPEVHPDARTFHIGRRGRRARHFFLFRVTSDQVIDIGRLLHDSMDLQRHLPEGFGATDS